MILCLTGTNPYSFERLVKHVDIALGQKHKVIIQKGNTPYIPQFSEYFDFCDNDQLIKHINNSELIISQGGYGSMMEAIQMGKKIIAVPRKIDFKEALDDQSELVRYFAEKKYILGCFDVGQLEKFVSKCLKGSFHPKEFQPETTNSISNIVESYLKHSNIH